MRKHRHRLLALACALASASLLPLAHAAAYRWVDEKGVVHYSDQPRPGAERVDLPQVQTYRAPPAPNVRVASSAQDPAGAAGPAVTCSIVSPSQDQTLVNETSLRVGFTGPAGATPRLLLNGAAVQAQGAGGALVVAPIARGTYQAVVTFMNSESGREACRTPPVTFHVRQASLLSPARPAGPNNAPRAPGTTGTR